MNSDSSTLEELLNAPEGEHLQFKEAKNRLDFGEALKICCALSNCGGGKLVLGITDKRPRKVVGSNAFQQAERERKNLMDKLRVFVDFQIYQQEGKRVLVFDVAGRPTGLPIQLDGIVWCYEGDSLVPMQQDMLRRIYAESGHDFSADICPDSTLKDLDKNAIGSFRENWARKSGKSSIKTLSVEQLLRDCGAMTDDGVTYAALILFGTSSALNKHLPQSEIVFEFRTSEASGPAQQRREFRIGFFACYDQIWELINLRNDKRHYQEGLFVYDIPTFNERVIREALLNAVSHRDYQLSGSVFIRQYPGKLIIESPGGLPVGITLENILDRQSPRNRRMAEILALCGLVERSGQGMNLIYEINMKEAKPLPDFSGTDAYFVCIGLNGIDIDERMLSMMAKIGNEKLESFSTDDFLVVNSLFHEKKLPPHLHPRLNQLIEKGIVERHGRNKFVLARKLYKSVGKPGVHTRLAGLDRNLNKELILKHLLENKEAGAPLREISDVLPNHNRGQLQTLLRELRKEGRVYSRGKTAAAKWFISPEQGGTAN